MTYAIVDVGGNQIILEPGKFYDLNCITASPGDIVHFNRVLFLSQNNVYQIGKPCLDQISIKATILRHFNGEKITVFKMKSKKNNRLKKGHRQKLTRVFIEDILS
uniref:Large ribosomal subunit protein bL21c n=1 Tax=Polysiphonia infestans TaxID=2006978 RepID=A0A1Z1MEM9_9FLOR|nr:ribosomal protein L21 [Polysiphonia infestans]ARW64285.1 ribosomal protein L21 [Polysiphonia infestans]